ncbi:MAG: tryptophan--tRNA ligase, partial [Acidimicrobiales bacterium]
VLYTAEEISHKVRKAVTDTDGEVRYDPVVKPGLSNLIELLAASTARTIDEVVGAYERYGPLKADLADALVEVLAPVSERYRELAGNPAEIASLLDKGAEKAASVASKTLERAREAVGLLGRS